MKFNSLKEQSFYKLAMVIIFFGFLAASFVLTPRIGLESSNKIVSQAICHKDCYELIKAAGKDSQDIETYFETENELLKAYKSAGVNTIIVHDASLERLARTGAIQLELSGGLAIVRETHEHIFDELQEIGQRRYKKQIEVYGESPNRVMEFRGSTVPVDLHDGKLKRAVQQLPFGIMSHEIKRFSKLGFNIVLAPENFWGVTDKDIDILWNRVNKIGANIVGVMHAGYQMFGYPKYMKYAAEKMGRLPLILQEHWTQLGFFPVQGHLEMSRFCGYNVIRAFTIDYYEMKELRLEDALRRWAIADDERNIRVNIITPFLSGSKDLIRTNIDYAKRITTNVKNRGFSIGVAKPMEVYFPNRFLLMPVIASIVAAGVLLLQLLFGWGFNRSLLLWGIITGVALFENFTSGTITHQTLALIAAIVFPVLAVYRMTDMLDNVTDVPVIQIIANAAICLALCVVLSLCGACIMSAILTDARFLLEIDYYRGVKLTFVVPLVLMLILCIKKYNIFDLNKCSSISEFFRNFKDAIKRYYDKNSMFKITFIVVILCGILFLFIARTGHSWDVPVPDLELQMRYWLQEHLYARPRVKEFMVGHVAFCLLVLAAHKQWHCSMRILLTIGALVGQVSLVETFCHMRTPFLMSVARACGGFAFGIVLGILAIFICIIFNKLRNREQEHER